MTDKSPYHYCKFLDDIPNIQYCELLFDEKPKETRYKCGCYGQVKLYGKMLGHNTMIEFNNLGVGLFGRDESILNGLKEKIVIALGKLGGPHRVVWTGGKRFFSDNGLVSLSLS